MVQFSLRKEMLRGAFQYVGNIISVSKYLRISHMKERLNLFGMGKLEPICKLY